MNRIVLWGHKLHESTHSYVQNGYYRAFKKLGWETYWVDTRDNLDSIDFADSLIFVEHSVRKGIPIRKDCKYVTHHFPENELLESEVPFENIIKLGNYLAEKECNEKVAELTYWDNSTRSIWQPWGTDLLPNEIDTGDYVSFNPNAKKLNYIAMLYEQGHWWAKEFANIIGEKHGVEFVVYTQSATDEENRNFIRESFLCPDFRSDWHLQCGYIPCRMWKNISYGRITGTNSPLVKRALGDYVVFGGTPQTLYQNLLEAEMNKTVNMKEAMTYVKEKHTYINRVNNILKFL
jgi:hypothetical protein